MKTILYTPYDCLLKINDKDWFLNKNESFVFEDARKISVFPTQKSGRYSFNVDLSSISNTIYYSAVQKENEVLIFLLDGIISENVDIFSFANSGAKSSVEIGKENIIFKTQKHTKNITLPRNIKDIKCGNIFDIDYACFSDNLSKYIILYNTKTNKTKLFQGDEIELKEYGFVVTNQSNKFYKKIVEEYVVDKDGLKSKSKVFSKNENNHSSIAFKFMSAIKVKDWEGAHSLLCDNLKSSLSADALKIYFKDIGYIFSIDNQTIFALSNGENVIYNFSIENDKIAEINDNF